MDFTLTVTADGGYSDSVTFNMIVGQQVEDFETGDFSAFNWQLSGNLPWIVNNVVVYEGMYSARSGSITDGQSSTMSVTLEDLLAGDISFYYKVSSESRYDNLKFYIDGAEQGKWSGEEGWTEVSFPVTAGTRTFEWTYSKDTSIAGGDDTAWIDDIVFP